MSGQRHIPFWGEFLMRIHKGYPITVLPAHAPFVLQSVIGPNATRWWYVDLYLLRGSWLSQSYPICSLSVPLLLVGACGGRWCVMPRLPHRVLIYIYWIMYGYIVNPCVDVGETIRKFCLYFGRRISRAHWRKTTRVDTCMLLQVFSVCGYHATQTAVIYRHQIKIL